MATFEEMQARLTPDQVADYERRKNVMNTRESRGQDPYSGALPDRLEQGRGPTLPAYESQRDNLPQGSIISAPTVRSGVRSLLTSQQGSVADKLANLYDRVTGQTRGQEARDETAALWEARNARQQEQSERFVPADQAIRDQLAAGGVMPTTQSPLGQKPREQMGPFERYAEEITAQAPQAPEAQIATQPSTQETQSGPTEYTPTEGFDQAAHQEWRDRQGANGGALTPEQMDAVEARQAGTGAFRGGRERTRGEMDQLRQQQMNEAPRELQSGEVFIPGRGIMRASDFSQQDRERREREAIIQRAQAFRGALTHAPDAREPERQQQAQRMAEINAMPEGEAKQDALAEYRDELKAREEAGITRFDSFQGSVGSPDAKAREQRMETYKNRLKELSDARVITKREARQMERENAALEIERDRLRVDREKIEAQERIETERNRIQTEQFDGKMDLLRLQGERTIAELQRQTAGIEAGVDSKRIRELEEKAELYTLKFNMLSERENYGVTGDALNKFLAAEQSMIDQPDTRKKMMSLDAAGMNQARRMANSFVQSGRQTNHFEALFEAIDIAYSQLESTRK